jgi:hypothetical protein
MGELRAVDSLVKEAEHEAIKATAHLQGLRVGDEIVNTVSGARGRSAQALNRSYRQLRVVVTTETGKRRYRWWPVEHIDRANQAN